jgi:hypothetical protein
MAAAVGEGSATIFSVYQSDRVSRAPASPGISVHNASA